jgi:hypothetical protein
VGNGGHDNAVYLVPVSEVKEIPLAPFAYWVTKRIRRLFVERNAVEGGKITVKQGLATADDFRFVRTAWEAPCKSATDLDHTWFLFAKGGQYSPFYADVHLKVNWRDSGCEIRFFGDPSGAKPLSRPQNTAFYKRPGLTWPLRTQSGLALRAVPGGCIFGHKGPCIFVDQDDRDQLLRLLGITTSEAFRALVEIQMAFGSYEVGVIQRTVIPASLDQRLGELALSAWSAKRSRDNASLTSHAFVKPVLGKIETTLNDRVAEWAIALVASDAAAAEAQAAIDEIARRLYGLDDGDQKAIQQTLGLAQNLEPGQDESEDQGDGLEDIPPSGADARILVGEVIEYATGCCFGRWDIRVCKGDLPPPVVPDPFASLPDCPPGMLQGDDGLPMSPKAGGRLRAEGDYPIDIAWDGILVDDAEHPLDIERRIRSALSAIWGDRGDALEYEACTLLGVPTLRDWLRRPTGFFADHLKRYSKSRRQAPIYWPLSTKSGDYTLWIYYHRLNDQTLHKCLADFLDPKIAKVEKEIASLSSKSASKAAELRDFLNELKGLRDEIERVIKLPWRPNLNDGVLITASPLWKLFRLSQWSKDLKACWEELEKGDYDWAHLAYTIWTERVEKVCEKDRSIAIAHGLEHLCKVDPPKPKKPRGKKASS